MCPIICEVCDGSGGWDKSRDPEVYDDFEECIYCGGTGQIDD